MAGSSQGPATVVNGNTAINLDFYGKQATKQLREGIEESVDVEKALRRRREEHLEALKNSRDALERSIREEEPPAWSAFPGGSPALTINTIIGLIGAAVYLFGYSFSDEQMDALEVVVSAAFLVIPVVAGWLIRTINSK